MPSRDILDRLLEVERRAEALVSEAEAEASRRRATAADSADESFKRAYEKAASRIEAERREAEAGAQAEHEARLREFRERLEATSVDKATFEAACARYLDELL